MNISRFLYFWTYSMPDSQYDMDNGCMDVGSSPPVGESVG